MADRVRRPAEHEEMLTELRDRGIFKTYKDALVFAACLGYERRSENPSRRRPDGPAAGAA